MLLHGPSFLHKFMRDYYIAKIKRLGQVAPPFEVAFTSFCIGRRVYVTNGGRMGWAPETARQAMNFSGVGRVGNRWAIPIYIV